MMSSFGRENRGVIAEQEKFLGGHSILACTLDVRRRDRCLKFEAATRLPPTPCTFQRPHSPLPPHTLHNALKCSPSTFSQSVCLHVGSHCWL
jgi:hypothetical protein